MIKEHQNTSEIPLDSNFIKDIRELEQGCTEDDLQSFFVSENMLKQAQLIIDRLTPEQKKKHALAWITLSESSLRALPKIVVGAFLQTFVQQAQSQLEAIFDHIFLERTIPLSSQTAMQLRRLIEAGFDTPKYMHADDYAPQFKRLRRLPHHVPLQVELILMSHFGEGLLFGYSHGKSAINKYGYVAEKPLNEHLLMHIVGDQDLKRLYHLLDRNHYDPENKSLIMSLNEVAHFLISKNGVADRTACSFIEQSHQHEAIPLRAQVLLDSIKKAPEDGRVSSSLFTAHSLIDVIQTVVSYHYSVPEGSHLELDIILLKGSLSFGEAVGLLKIALESCYENQNTFSLPPVINSLIADAINQETNKTKSGQILLHQLIFTCVAIGVDLPEPLSTAFQKKPHLLDTLLLDEKIKMISITGNSPIAPETAYHSIDAILKNGVDALPQSINQENQPKIEISHAGFSLISHMLESYDLSQMRRLRDSMHQDAQLFLITMDWSSLLDHLKKSLKNHELYYLDPLPSEFNSIKQPIQITDLFPPSVLDGIRNQIAGSDSKNSEIIADLDCIPKPLVSIPLLSTDSFIDKFPQEQQVVMRLMLNYPQDAELFFSIRKNMYLIPKEKMGLYIDVFQEIHNCQLPEIKKTALNFFILFLKPQIPVMPSTKLYLYLPKIACQSAVRF